jgi:hypothetical protein
VLTVTIPVAEQAKARRIEIGRGGQRHEGHKLISGSSQETGQRQGTPVQTATRG